MTWMLGGIVVVVTALVQVTWAAKLSVLGAFPNLVLVAVVLVTWARGQRAGLLWACAGGVLLDLAAAGPLGPHALALLAGAYLVGFWVRNVDRASALQAVIATAACTAVYSLVLVGCDDLLDLPMPPLNVAAELAAGAAVYNAVLVMPAMALLRLTGERTLGAVE